MAKYLLLSIGLSAIGVVLSTVTEMPPPVYTSTNNFYSCKKTLSKPGAGCDSHPDYPDTIQCALRKTCISFSQFKDGKCDCCGKDANCDTCDDHSDEDRVAPPGDKTCQTHPHYNLSLTFQCATKRDICLSRLTNWNDGFCDCCPEYDRNCCHPKCLDHSDEECISNEWKDKFSCDGNCISINKLDDSKADCNYECVESNTVARQTCQSAKEMKIQQTVTFFCEKLEEKNTAYYRCPTGDQRCITLDFVRDGKSDCENGEDEDEKIHPDCDSREMAKTCDAEANQCISIQRGINYDCRCISSDSTRTCNKNSDSRRQKLF